MNELTHIFFFCEKKDQQTNRIDNLRSRKVVDDDIPSLDDDEEEETLRPVHIFSSTATFMLDGIEQDYLPDTSNLYYKSSKKRGTTTVILAQEDESLGVRTKKIKRDSTVEQTEKHVDIIELNKHFFYAHAERNTTTTTSVNNPTSFSSSNDRIINHDRKNSKSNNHDGRRNLRNAPILVLSNDSDVLTTPPVNRCFRYMNVELAIAFETSFCEAMGGADEAVAEISRIIAEVSARYQQQGLCTYISISHLEGYCELEKDPYRYYVGMNRSGCGSYGLLHKFKEFWERKRTHVKRDVAHLFTGTGLECSDDGCIVGKYFLHICRQQEFPPFIFLTLIHSHKNKFMIAL